MEKEFEMEKKVQVRTAPLANPENIVKGDVWRFTILTDCLIRVEYDEEGLFNDEATQTVLCRDFPKVDYKVFESKDGMVIETENLRLVYAGGKFTQSSLRVLVKHSLDNEGNIWYFGNKTQRPLGGTARTLDRVDGACELERGLFSSDGWEVIDDSATLIFKDGWVEPRRKGVIDMYLFGYDKEYLRGLKDFYYLTGPVPMLPRFAMGNWWCRWYRYSEKTFLELMDRFRKEGVPFTTSVIDMDWHLVDIDPKYGVGWTGYTWNRELFPDPKGFLAELHRRGMKTALNVHPADGVRAFEECYPPLAKAMGVDVEREETVDFDVTNPEFMDAYFKYVNHPMEDDGVDFWWLDWQQGTSSKVEGLDPLWAINYRHFEDSARGGKRPVIFSRYAGVGSHRYPIGFSGDTYISWDSLAFQPYFNITAANIGYGWWGNDMGGFMHGKKDDELYGRWAQLGAFSPICRMHSTKNEFNGREPWRFSLPVRQMADEFLRLRHRMIPYLYTMNERASNAGIPLCTPMYYSYPNQKEAYQVKNQYFFGSELICAPITAPQEKDAQGGSVDVWIPEGLWFDFFTGLPYQGGRKMKLYRGIESFPVLAKAGGIIPMTEEIFDGAALKNPSAMTLRVYAGANGEFTLYEDDNETTGYQDGICARTNIAFRWEGEQTLTIKAAEGNAELLPTERTWSVEIPTVKETTVMLVKDGKEIPVETSYDTENAMLKFTLEACPVTETITVVFPAGLELETGLAERRLFSFLDYAQIEYDLKLEIYRRVQNAPSVMRVLSELPSLTGNQSLCNEVMEFLTAYEK